MWKPSKPQGIERKGLLGPSDGNTGRIRLKKYNSQFSSFAAKKTELGCLNLNVYKMSYMTNLAAGEMKSIYLFFQSKKQAMPHIADKLDDIPGCAP